MSAVMESCLCTQAQLESEAFRQWMPRIHEPFNLHRKLWEYCFVAQGLFERGMLRPGRRGLGFGVGREPLTALFASYDCEIVATDLHPDSAIREGHAWIETGQHAASLDALNERGICEPDIFARRVRFRYVDMNEVPPDLEGFDFVWSSCALEHLGSIKLGKRFIYRVLKCLRPGGVAIHTTEYNVSSSRSTMDCGPTVLFRKRDIQEIVRVCHRRGYKVKMNYDLGTTRADRFVDVPPYKERPHLKLQIGEYVATSCGLIIASRLRRRR